MFLNIVLNIKTLNNSIVSKILFHIKKIHHGQLGSVYIIIKCPFFCMSHKICRIILKF